MRIVAWNIQHGGGARRMPQIALALAEQAPDLVAISEFRPGVGGQILGVLHDQGLEHQLIAEGTTLRGRGNSVCLASRWALEATGRTPALGHLRGRWLDAWCPALGAFVSAVHVPDDSRPGDKAEMWQWLVDLARERGRSRSWIVAGDMNTGRRGSDIPDGRSRCEAQLGAFWSLGMHDAWRTLHPREQDATWQGVGSWAGAPQRIDAVYVSEAWRDSLRRADHLHGVRAARVSDHSMVVVEVQVQADNGLGRTPGFGPVA